jgi:hypothetical protein
MPIDLRAATTPAGAGHSIRKSWAVKVVDRTVVNGGRRVADGI